MPAFHRSVHYHYHINVAPLISKAYRPLALCLKFSADVLGDILPTASLKCKIESPSQSSRSASPFPTDAVIRTERNSIQGLTEKVDDVGELHRFFFSVVKQVSGLQREEYSDYFPLIPGAYNTLTARKSTGARPSLPGPQ